MTNVKKILFVCAHNNCRSVMAQMLFNKMAMTRGLDVRAESAGNDVAAGYGVHFQAQEILRKRGMDAASHVTRPMTKEIAADADLICPVDETQKEWILQKYPEAAEKVRTLISFCDEEERSVHTEVPDPADQETEFYTKVFDIVHVTVRALLRTMKQI